MKINKIENIDKKNSDINKSLDKAIPVTFKYSSNDKKDINESVLLNLFFIIRNNLNEEFNDSIHNRTIKINSQIKDALEKIECCKNKNTFKNEFHINKKDNKNNNIEKIKNNKEKLCDSLYKEIKSLKEIYKIKKNILSTDNILFLNNDD